MVKKAENVNVIADAVAMEISSASNSEKVMKDLEKIIVPMLRNIQDIKDMGNLAVANKEPINKLIDNIKNLNKLLKSISKDYNSSNTKQGLEFISSKLEELYRRCLNLAINPVSQDGKTKLEEAKSYRALILANIRDYEIEKFLMSIRNRLVKKTRVGIPEQKGFLARLFGR